MQASAPGKSTPGAGCRPIAELASRLQGCKAWNRFFCAQFSVPSRSALPGWPLLRGHRPAQARQQQQQQQARAPCSCCARQGSGCGCSCCAGCGCASGSCCSCASATCSRPCTACCCLHTTALYHAPAAGLDLPPPLWLHSLQVSWSVDQARALSFSRQQRSERCRGSCLGRGLGRLGHSLGRSRVQTCPCRSHGRICCPRGRRACLPCSPRHHHRHSCPSHGGSLLAASCPAWLPQLRSARRAE